MRGEDLLGDVSAEAAVEPGLRQMDLRLGLGQQIDHLLWQHLQSHRDDDVDVDVCNQWTARRAP